VRLLAAVLALLSLSASCSRRPALPELPQPATEKFLPAVREQFRKAHDEARKNPRDAAANGRLGMIFHAHDQFESAAVCYQRARWLDARSFQWVYYLAIVQSGLGKNAEAIDSLRQALRLKPDYAPARLRMADVLFASGEFRESAQLYRAIITTDPNNPAACYGLGRVQAARGEWSAAAVSQQKACDLFPAYGAAHYALAQAYRTLGENAKAQRHLLIYEQNKLNAPPSDDPLLGSVRQLSAGATQYIAHGITLEASGRLAEAAAEHEKALAIDPGLAQAHVNLISLYGRLGQPEKAEQHYRAAVQLNPNLAEAHYNYGVLLYDQRKYSEAGEAFRRATAINPFYAEAHNNLGAVLEREGRLDEALREFEKVIQDKPDHRQAHFHLGRLLLHRHRNAEAIQHFLKTLTVDDESTPAYLYALAGAYARSGDHPRALEYGRKARASAAQRGQTQLLASIDRDLRILEQR
jgi:tetratricopeptide (TPR) repeat protein